MNAAPSPVLSINMNDRKLNDFEHEARYAFVAYKLNVCNGNRCRAAKLMGIHRNTLLRILQEMKALPSK